MEVESKDGRKSQHDVDDMLWGNFFPFLELEPVLDCFLTGGIFKHRLTTLHPPVGPDIIPPAPSGDRRVTLPEEPSTTVGLWKDQELEWEQPDYVDASGSDYKLDAVTSGILQLYFMSPLHSC